jgi:hypothetical protein
MFKRDPARGIRLLVQPFEVTSTTATAAGSHFFSIPASRANEPAMLCHALGSHISARRVRQYTIVLLCEKPAFAIGR